MGGSALRRSQTLPTSTASAHKGSTCRPDVVETEALPQPNCTTALIQGSCLPLPKPREAFCRTWLHCAATPRPLSRWCIHMQQKAQHMFFVFEAASCWSPCRSEAYRSGTTRPPLFSVTQTQHVDVGSTASRTVASLRRAETPSTRKCGWRHHFQPCSSSSPASAPREAALIAHRSLKRFTPISLPSREANTGLQITSSIPGSFSINSDAWAKSGCRFRPFLVVVCIHRRKHILILYQGPLPAVRLTPITAKEWERRSMWHFFPLDNTSKFLHSTTTNTNDVVV